MDGTRRNEKYALDWMLQNNHVNDLELAYALVERFYSGLYALALDQYNNEEYQAHHAAKEAIEAAVYNRHTFWGEIPLPVWLYKQSLKYYRRKAFRQRNRNLFPPLLTLLQPHRSDDHSQETGKEMRSSLCREKAQERTAFVLRYAANLTVEEIAAIFGEQAGTVSNQLMAATTRFNTDMNAYEGEAGSLGHRNIRELLVRVPGDLLSVDEREELISHLQSCEACRTWSLEVRELESSFKTGLGQSRKLKLSSEQELSRFAREIEGLVRRERTHRKSIRTAKEAALALIAIATVSWAALLADFRLLTTGNQNDLPEISILTTPVLPGGGGFKYSYILKEGDTLEGIARQANMPLDLLIELNNLQPGVILTTGKELTLTWNSALSRSQGEMAGAKTSPVLTAQATEAEIWERIFDSSQLWNTLWVDISIVQYGSPGYDGPPLLSSRWQFWLRKPSDSVRLSPTNPDRGWMSIVSTLGGVTFWRVGDSEKIFADFNRARPPGVFWTDQASLLKWMKESGSLQVVGTDRVARRPTLVVDWENHNGSGWNRMWVDTSLGLILRHQQMSGSGSSNPIFETIYNAIAVDKNLPIWVFNPSRFNPPGFARDYTSTTFEVAQP